MYDIIDISTNKRVIVYYDSDALPKYIEYIVDDTTVKYVPKNNYPNENRPYLSVYHYDMNKLKEDQDKTIKVFDDVVINGILDATYF
jgi:hypothetical protein